MRNNDLFNFAGIKYSTRKFMLYRLSFESIYYTLKLCWSSLKERDCMHVQAKPDWGMRRRNLDLEKPNPLSVYSPHSPHSCQNEEKNHLHPGCRNPFRAPSSFVDPVGPHNPRPRRRTRRSRHIRTGWASGGGECGPQRGEYTKLLMIHFPSA